MSALRTLVTTRHNEKGAYEPSALVQATCDDCGCERYYRITSYGSWRLRHECGGIWQCYRDGDAR